MARGNGNGPPPHPRDIDSRQIAESVTDACLPMFKSIMPPDDASDLAFAVSHAIHNELSPFAHAVMALADRVDAITLRG